MNEFKPKIVSIRDRNGDVLLAADDGQPAPLLRETLDGLRIGPRTGTHPMAEYRPPCPLPPARNYFDIDDLPDPIGQKAKAVAAVVVCAAVVALALALAWT